MPRHPPADDFDGFGPVVTSAVEKIYCTPQEELQDRLARGRAESRPDRVNICNRGTSDRDVNGRCLRGLSTGEPRAISPLAPSLSFVTVA